MSAIKPPLTQPHHESRNAHPLLPNPPESLSTIVKNTHQDPSTNATLHLTTIPTNQQRHALELLETITTQT